MRSFCVYGANTALYCFICVLNPTFSCSDCVQLVFIAATGSSRMGFSDGFILASGAYVQPVNADTIIVHNGYCKGFVSNALHRTFAVALVARTSHAGFVNEFTGTIALATSNYIRHIHTTLHCADKIRAGKRPELGCVYSWKLWYFPCNIVIHNLVYAVFVYCQIVFISITFPVCRVRVLHNERKPVLSETSIIRFSHILSPFFLAGCYAIATSLSAPIFLSRITPS